MSSLTSLKKRFPLSKVIVPAFTIGILFVLWRLNLKWATVPVILFVLFYFLILPKIVRKRTEIFNRKALLLLTSGKAKELPGLVKRSLLLQLFGPRGPLDAKLALAYLQCEEYQTAISCFESGIPYAPPTERAALQSGLATALFAIGDFGRAEAEARAVVDNITRLSELLVIMARARIGLGKLDDETRKLLDEAETLSPSQDISLMISMSRIELALLLGRKPSEMPEKADSSRKLIRAWIHLVRGMQREHRGDMAKAAESYRRAEKTLPESFVSKRVQTLLDAISLPEDGVEGDDKCGVDPALRRKKRRRR